MALIHSTALVDPAAELAEDVSVGAYTVIGPEVVVGAGTRIGPHCVIEGRTRIGRDNQIFQFSSLGAAPQDKKYAGEPTELHIGDRNTIREFCTFNRGTAQDAGVTKGAFFHHFASKADLGRAILDRYAAEDLETLDRTWAQAEGLARDPLGQLLVFVGLVAPHLARRLVGGDYRLILLLSALSGAALLTIADVVGRLIVPPGELEAGLVVALVGAPVMIALVRGRGAGAL